MQIKRDFYLDELRRRMHNGMIKIITGIRRCGKSYLLFEIFYNYLINRGTDPNHIIKIDFEDRRNKQLRDPDALLRHIDSQMTDSGMYYILLDEIQNVMDFEDVLNSYLKIKNADVYVTGSNSRFLSKDVVTEFRGRGDEIKISPLTFSEFFAAFDGTREQALAQYLTYGGLPKLVEMTDNRQKQRYLIDLFETTYLTDIKERYGIRQEATMDQLIDVMASSIGGLTNPTKLMNTFKSETHTAVSKNTIINYLEILQEAFLIEQSLRFDIKGKRYINTPSKYYFTDLGLRNARIHFRQPDTPALLENLVYNELRHRAISVDVGVVNIKEPNNDGTYSNKRLEVDFVCNMGDKRCYVQSAYRIPDPEKMRQELRSLKVITDSFLKVVITDEPVIKHYNDDGILIMNFYDFLLDADSFSL